jgi:RNA recognition motif-containing protein
LQELFKGIGAVRNVEIVYNRSTHRSKGYGFVEMLRMDEAIRAVEVLHDQHFMGRKMTVSGAKSKGQDEREDKDERPERESKPIVVASATPVHLEVPATPVVEAPAAEEAPDAVVETLAVEAIVEPVSEPAVENVAVVDAAPEEVAAAPVESAADLEAKYGFGDSSDKPGQA